MSGATPAPDGGPERQTRPKPELAVDTPKAAIPSETLLRGHPSVAIHHQGAVYRLQATRQGKLILTK